ncbi:MAG: sigma factor-like helix-turn-helix DNA-binding protein [Flavonifractor plautii]
MDHNQGGGADFPAASTAGCWSWWPPLQLPRPPGGRGECVGTPSGPLARAGRRGPAQGVGAGRWLCVLVRSGRGHAAAPGRPDGGATGGTLWPWRRRIHAPERALRCPDGLCAGCWRLSREERRLFTLRFVYGLSSAELGGVLGLSPNGVDARVSRLRKKLKRLLARQGLGLWEREGTK